MPELRAISTSSSWLGRRGNACTPIQQVSSTAPETGLTYVVRAGDVGSTLRLRVTADVNGDLTADGLDNHLPKAVEVDTAPSAVVTARPVPAGPVPPTPGPGPGAPILPGPGTGPRDTTAPRLSAIKITKKSFAAGGKGTAFRVTISERAALRVTIGKATKGRRVGKVCKPQTKANRRRKPCAYAKTVAALRRDRGGLGRLHRQGRQAQAPGRPLHGDAGRDRRGGQRLQACEAELHDHPPLNRRGIARLTRAGRGAMDCWRQGRCG